jgi:hypothetical protein
VITGVQFLPDDVQVVRRSTIRIAFEHLADSGMTEREAIESIARSYHVAPWQIGSVLDSMGIVKWWICDACGAPEADHTREGCPGLSSSGRSYDE